MKKEPIEEPSYESVCIPLIETMPVLNSSLSEYLQFVKITEDEIKDLDTLECLKNVTDLVLNQPSTEILPIYRALHDYVWTLKAIGIELVLPEENEHQEFILDICSNLHLAVFEFKDILPDELNLDELECDLTVQIRECGLTFSDEHGCDQRCKIAIYLYNLIEIIKASLHYLHCRT